MKRTIIPIALLTAGLLVAGCANTTVSHPTLANRCLDRPFEAGKCQQPTNFRLFALDGPVIAE
jgi:hypothetical protein